MEHRISTPSQKRSPLHPTIKYAKSLHIFQDSVQYFVSTKYIPFLFQRIGHLTVTSALTCCADNCCGMVAQGQKGRLSQQVSLKTDIHMQKQESRSKQCFLWVRHEAIYRKPKPRDTVSRSIGQGKVSRRKYKRLKLRGSKAYDRSSD